MELGLRIGTLFQSASPWFAESKSYTDSELSELYLKELENSIIVQQNLLYNEPPKPMGVDIAVRYLSMMGVSGDYYDFLPIDERRLGLAIGDICGKGMGAAMLMASVCGTIRTLVQIYPTAVEDLLADLNKIIYRCSASHQFMTLAYGIWDRDAHTFTYSCAGHPPMLHYQAATGKVRELRVGGMVLGILENTEYPVETVSLETGDVLVMYTDGIIEASDVLGNVFGMNRLSQVVSEHGEDSSETMMAAILTTASQFTCGGLRDDTTVMVVKRIPIHDHQLQE